MEYYSNKNVILYNGKMQEALPKFIKDNSIDSIVTDPPYELNFMNKGWDNSGVAFQKETWEHCFRVLKEGGYLLAFGGSRTYHRIACAIEDAGFEIRDTIMWLYGSGFPKSMNIGLAIDKKNGVESKVVGTGKSGVSSRAYQSEETTTAGDYEIKKATNEWAGWGTCLKPAFEPIIVARKPFKGSLVDNVIANGVGGLNIDECRVGFGNETDKRVGTDIKRGDSLKYKLTNIEKEIMSDWENEYDFVWSENTKQWNNENEFKSFLDNYFMKDIEINFNIFDYETIIIDSQRKKVIPFVDSFKNILNSNSMFGVSNVGVQMYKDNGRFPANLILTYDENDSDEVCGGFPSEKGNSASRYFYCAKASKKDRDEGLDELEEKFPASAEFRPNHMEKALKGEDGNPYGRWKPRQNIHPTVKPTDLMQYLVRLVTPANGVILDPFMGSGSTGKAVMYENNEKNKNYSFIGVEMTNEYLPIAKARIYYAQYGKVLNKQEKKQEKQQLTLFDFI